jgi:hypothetical protein
MKVLDILTAAKKLIETPEKWTKQYSARTRDGVACPSYDPKAVCFCSTGALTRAAGVRRDKHHRAPSVFYAAERTLADAMTPASQHNEPVFFRITKFNDEHDHSEVMAAFDKAIKFAQRMETAD